MEWENIPEKIDQYVGFVYVIERLNAEEGEKKFYWGFWGGCGRHSKVVLCDSYL